MDLIDKNRKHINYVKNLVEQYNESKYNIKEYCYQTNLKEINLKKCLNEYLDDFYILKINELTENSYLVYDVGNDTENLYRKKDLIGKITIIDCFIDTPVESTDDYEKIDFKIKKNNLLILKIKFINLKYHSMIDTGIFEKIYIFNEKFKFTKSIKNQSLLYSKYGEDIGYRDTYNRKYLPKIPYNATLVFDALQDMQNGFIAFRNLYVEGTNIKKVQIDVKREKDLSNRATCPNCNSLNTIKDGKRNGKQRYQCNDCKRRFTQK